jgi:fucose 4-O-acetylase-like acetyltransferase
MMSLATASPTVQPRRERDPFVDNAKAILIALVVIGHTVGQVLDSYPPASTLYTWIYLFHMPAFVFLCGLLTTSPDVDGPRVRSMVRALLVPYLIFQVAFTAYYEWFGQDMNWGVDRLLTPLYHLWFLPALFIWRMAAPFLTRLRLALPLSIGACLLAGTSTTLSGAFALNRAAAFLPFFVLGLLYGRRMVRALPSTPAARVAAVATLLLAVPVAALAHEKLGVRWLYWNASYRTLGVDLLEGVVLRLAIMTMALAMMTAVLVLVPRGRHGFTGVGQMSMYPYLLHPFATLAFAWSGYSPGRLWEVALVCAGAVALTAALAAPPVRRVLKLLVEPPVQRLFHSGQ